MTTGLVKKENTILPPENPSNLSQDDPFVPHLDWLHPSLIDYDDLSYTHSVDIRTLITPRPDYFAFDPEYRTLRGGNVTTNHFPLTPFPSDSDLILHSVV